MRRALGTFALSLLLVAPAAWGGTKENQHQQMISLAQQMRSLKAQGQAAGASYAALRAQYNAISAAMGGDAPGWNSPADGAAVDGRGAQAPQGAGGVIPPPPAGCQVTTVVATQNTPVAIADVAVSSSTVNVAGAGPYVWDINLTTNITHTFAADMDITIMSPAGTVVTLSTDNGAGNDNVYNGTLWDDDANPAGQVPYTTNDGLATDHLYVNLTTATPLVPEEAMGAFIGEDPNGIWTISVSDDLAGDTGSIDSWSIQVSTLPAAPTVANTVATQNTPVAIADVAVSSSTLNVAGAGTSILDVNLTTNITHTFAADMDITIMSPAGTVVTLSTDNGAGNDNVYNGTLWDDDANPAGQVPYTTNDGVATDHLYVNLTTATPLVPEEAMAAFIGEDPNGTWTITVSDDLAGDTGSIDSWSLSIDTATCAAPCQLTCPADVAQNNDLDQCGAVVTYPAPGTTGTCGAITCVAASGSFFPVGTTNVTCTEAPQNSCSFNITVDDAQPPAISCPADIDQDLPPGETDGIVNFPPPAVSDNCPGVGAPSCIPPSGATFPAGSSPVDCSVADSANLTNSCQFNVNLGGVSILEIPTASQWGLALLALALVGAAFLVLRRQI